MRHLLIVIILFFCSCSTIKLTEAEGVYKVDKRLDVYEYVATSLNSKKYVIQFYWDQFLLKKNDTIYVKSGREGKLIIRK